MRSVFVHLVAIFLVAVACDGTAAPSKPGVATPEAPATQSPVPPRPPQNPPPPPRTGGSVEARRAEERALIPSLTAVQRWSEAATSGNDRNFAPSVVHLADGRYRMYANAGMEAGVDGGIISLISSDGITFTLEPGQRLSKTGDPKLDCTSSHPWVVAVSGGWRMYYQGNADCNPERGGPVQFRIFSAYSKDGLNFTREGVRIEGSPANGLHEAAHGRVLPMPDGSFRMYFSAGIIGKEGPSDLLSATSDDGLRWTVDLLPVMERAHDPAVIAVGGKILIFANYLADNLLILESVDGRTFTPTSWVDFYSQAGTRFEEFGDVDVALLPDGRLAMYGSGKGSRGVVTALQTSR